tara:strand:+ start:263 stop:751 length:489 start_codon:yes stop_codon:yes gene_type:complete
MSDKFVTILIMGVAGSGKTTIAELLSKKINAFLIEADEYHSKNNIDKMSAGIPLNDDDRYDWLIKIKEEIDKRKNFQNLVIACSALKVKYRSILNIKEDYLVYLKISKNTAKIRIKNRRDHFMPDSLVESQFAILEEPDDCITLDETFTPDEMTSHLTSIFK